MDGVDFRSVLKSVVFIFLILFSVCVYFKRLPNFFFYLGEAVLPLLFFFVFLILALVSPPCSFSSSLNHSFLFDFVIFINCFSKTIIKQKNSPT